MLPTYMVTQTLSPQQQAIKDQNDGASLNLDTLANNQGAFLNDHIAEPFQSNAMSQRSSLVKST